MKSCAEPFLADLFKEIRLVLPSGQCENGRVTHQVGLGLFQVYSLQVAPFDIQFLSEKYLYHNPLIFFSFLCKHPKAWLFIKFTALSYLRKYRLSFLGIVT